MRATASLIALGMMAACGGSDDRDADAPGGASDAGASSSGSTPTGASSGGPNDAGGSSGSSSGAGTDASAPDRFNNCLRPYAADSPWNTRPVNPVLGDATIPDSINGWRPVISDGAGYSTGAFCAAESDPPVEVHGAGGDIADKDVEWHFASITIPHWPADVSPATQSDGHADILDPVTKIVHSFNGLVHAPDGTWHARDYGWSRLDGRGWGDPAHYFQGARATGVPASAGIVRKHEFLAADTMYRHALSLSLPHNAIKKGDGEAPTAFVYPATSGDSKDNALANSGQIPEGSLLMLPASFDVATLPTPELQRIATTLQTYGAYVTDRNSATPFNIYVEIGTAYSLGGEGAAIDAALAQLQHALRPLASADSWVDGNEQPAVRQPPLEMQSMRGKWAGADNAVLYDAFSTWQQAVVLPAANQTLTSGWNNQRVPWGAPVSGATYRLTAETTGGGTLRYQVLCQAPDAAHSVDSGTLGNGQTFDVVWPAGTCTPFLTAKGTEAGATVRARLLAAP